MHQNRLPLGKLPVHLLKEMLTKLPTQAEELLLGPGIGNDCAIVKTSDQLLVFKSDPITFATDSIGWYLVQVNVNDIATTGAKPRWMLLTLLLPEVNAQVLLDQITSQVREACLALGLTVIGGHTEITHGLDRPILVGTVIGLIDKADPITPAGARSGDRLLLSKGIPIEATAILAREFPHRLMEAPDGLSLTDLQQAREFLFQPGISILAEAQVAAQVGGTHAMHDPTEGGLYAALWEMAEASGHSILVDLSKTFIFPLSQRICQILDLDPFGAIASGALLLAVDPKKAREVKYAIQRIGITCVDIGQFVDRSDQPEVRNGTFENSQLINRPEIDEISKLFG
jgi:hydrogenase expression/formation protein HypE